MDEKEKKELEALLINPHQDASRMRQLPGAQGINPTAKIPSKIDTTSGSALQRVLAGSQTGGPQIATGNNMDMLDSLITKPLTPQEVEQRKRSAASVEAIGQLGSLISAYANLAGTTQGAISKDIPTYQGPDVEGWEDRARQKQLEYLSLMNGLERENWERAFRGEELQFEMEQAQQQQQNREQERRDKLAQQGKENKLAEDKLAEQIRGNKAGEAVARQNAETARMNAETSAERAANQMKQWQVKFYASRGLNEDGSPVTKPVEGADGKMYNIDESVLFYKLGNGNNGTRASATAQQLYDKLPQEIKDRYQLKDWRDLNADASTAADAISDGILKDANFLKEVLKYEILTPRLAQQAPVSPGPKKKEGVEKRTETF